MQESWRTNLSACFGCSACGRSLSTLPRDALAWWPWDTTPIPEEPLPLNVSVLYGVDSGQEWLDGSVSIGGAADRADRRSRATPPPWDSGECMASWGLPELQREVDPRGYVVFSEGRQGTQGRVCSVSLVTVAVILHHCALFACCQCCSAVPTSSALLYYRTAPCCPVNLGLWSSSTF